MAVVHGAPEVLRTGVHDAGVERVEDDGEGPLPAFLERAGRFAGEEERVDLDVARVAGAAVEAREQGALAAGVEEVGIGGVRRDVAAFAAADGVGCGAAASTASPGRAGDADGGAILLRAADVIRNVAGGRDVIELGGGVLLAGPGLAAVDGDVAAAIVAFDHARGIGGVDPEIVIVAVRSAESAVGLAAVGRFVEAGVEDVHRVLGLGVGIDARVVEGALAQAAIFAGELPGGAGVIGDEDAAVLVFHDGVDAIGIAAGDGDADLSDDAGGHAGIAGDLGPVVAAVGGFEEAAGGAAAGEAPRRAVGVPDGGVENVGVGRVEAEIDGAGAIVAKEDFGPGLAAVFRAEDAAFLVGAVGVAERGDVDDVGIRRMNANAGDGLRVAEPDVLPGLAGVDGFVDAVALHDIAAELGLAHADVDHVGIGGGDRDGADGRALELAIGDGPPGEAAVGGLPKSAAGCAEEILERPGGTAGGGDGAAASRRPDATPGEVAEDGRVVGRGCRKYAGAQEREAEFPHGENYSVKEITVKEGGPGMGVTTGAQVRRLQVYLGTGMHST